MNYKIARNSSFFDYQAIIYFIKQTDSIYQLFNNINHQPNEIDNLLLNDNKKDLWTFNLSNKPYYLIIKKLPEKFTNNLIRNILAGIVKDSIFDKITEVGISFDNSISSEIDHKLIVSSSIEGIEAALYKFDLYKSESLLSSVINFTFIIEECSVNDSLILEYINLMNAVNISRDLVNEPANNLTPYEFSDRIESSLKNNDNVIVKTYDIEEIFELDLNAIFEVAKGSSNEPYFIEIEYSPKKFTHHIGLVGKGVTYDSGGYSIKKTESMLYMKIDMAGAATVFGIIKAAAENKLPIKLTGIIPAVENMISGSAYKPGDIIETHAGKTIEVIDTDAEGRIILADALSYISEKNPNFIFDFATLTGASVIALGQIAAAFFTNSTFIREKLNEAQRITDERIWEFPLWEEYAKLLESDIADIKNIGSKGAGAITAAKFLEYFVKDKGNWCHIDIAGPAAKHEFNNYSSKYDNAFGIRMMYEFLKSL